MEATCHKKNKSEVVTLGLDWTLRWSGSIKPAEFRKTGALQLRWPPGSGTYRSSSLHIFRPCLTKKWCEEKKSERAIRDGGRRQVWPVACGLWPGLRCQQILAHFVIITIPILPVQSRLAVAVSNTSIRYWSRERERERETPDALPWPRTLSAKTLNRSCSAGFRIPTEHQLGGPFCSLSGWLHQSMCWDYMNHATTLFRSGSRLPWPNIIVRRSLTHHSTAPPRPHV